MPRAVIILTDGDEPDEVNVMVTFEPMYDTDSTAHAAAAEIVAELQNGQPND